MSRIKDIKLVAVVLAQKLLYSDITIFLLVTDLPVHRHRAFLLQIFESDWSDIFVRVITNGLTDSSCSRICQERTEPGSIRRSLEVAYPGLIIDQELKNPFPLIKDKMILKKLC